MPELLAFYGTEAKKIMNNSSQLGVQCEICGKWLRTPQGLRGHEMFVHKEEHPAPTPTTEEDLDTVQVSQTVLKYYNYAGRKGFVGTIEEFLDQTVTRYCHLTARLNGKQLVEIERID